MPLGEERGPLGVFLVDVADGLDVAEEPLDAVVAEESADRFGPGRELAHDDARARGAPLRCPVDDQDQEVPQDLPLVGGPQYPLVKVRDGEPGRVLRAWACRG